MPAFSPMRSMGVPNVNVNDVYGNDADSWMPQGFTAEEGYSSPVQSPVQSTPYDQQYRDFAVAKQLNDFSNAKRQLSLQPEINILQDVQRNVATQTGLSRLDAIGRQRQMQPEIDLYNAEHRAQILEAQRAKARDMQLRAQYSQEQKPLEIERRQLANKQALDKLNGKAGASFDDKSFRGTAQGRKFYALSAKAEASPSDEEKVDWLNKKYPNSNYKPETVQDGSKWTEAHVGVLNDIAEQMRQQMAGYQRARMLTTGQLPTDAEPQAQSQAQPETPKASPTPITVTAPNGKPYTFATQEQADTFRAKFAH